VTRRRRFNALLVEGRALLALVIIIAVFSALSSNFLEPSNLIIMTRHVALNAIIAIGMLMVILHGGIDLSVGSTVGLSGVTAGYLLQGFDLPFTQLIAYPPVWVVIGISICIGAVVGYVNGFVVARLNVAPFIATLGMLYVARGLALVITNGETFTALRGDAALGNSGFLRLLAGRYFGIPMPVWVMIGFGIIFSILLVRTPFGRRLYAIGGNERAAELSGVPVKRVKIRVYILSGICAGVAGLLLTADLVAATPRAGEFYELNAIAAVVIGGATLSGGRGTIRGTIIGAFVIGFLVDGLVLVGVSVFWQQVIKGAVIVLAVALDQAQQRLSKRQKVNSADKVDRLPPRPSGQDGETDHDGEEAVRAATGR
jgi:erythritol transport system permease protein